MLFVSTKRERRCPDIIRKLGISGTDVLSLEEEVRRHGRRGAPSTEAAGRREPQVEATGCGFEPGQDGCCRTSSRESSEARSPKNVLVKKLQVGVPGERASSLSSVMRHPRSDASLPEYRDEDRAELRIRLTRPGCVTRAVWLPTSAYISCCRREGWQVNHKLVYRLYCRRRPAITRTKNAEASQQELPGRRAASGRRRRRPMRVGAWTSWPTSCSRARDFVS